MNPRQTIIINLVSGPGAGKTTLAAFLFYKLKTLGRVVEYIPEVAKMLVWKGEFSLLNNQHWVSQEQFKLFSALKGKVDIIITDGSLLHGLYYNRFNQDNLSNIDKTETDILKWYSQFNNIVIFVDRGDIAYEACGRYQSEKEARQVDAVLQHLLDKHKIAYVYFSTQNQEGILKYILEQIDVQTI